VGSLLTTGDHKGFGLSVAVEILGGILSGAGAASAEPSVFRNGTLVMCLDPARFLPLGDFHAQVGALLDWVRSAPLAAGAKEILIPGEPEARMERARRADGIPIDDQTWRQIREVALEVDVHA
jgi:hydroxycarboxylate dehydrogenase B